MTSAVLQSTRFKRPAAALPSALPTPPSSRMPMRFSGATLQFLSHQFHGSVCRHHHICCCILNQASAVTMIGEEDISQNPSQSSVSRHLFILILDRLFTVLMNISTLCSIHKIRNPFPSSRVPSSQLQGFIRTLLAVRTPPRLCFTAPLYSPSLS